MTVRPNYDRREVTLPINNSSRGCCFERVATHALLSTEVECQLLSLEFRLKISIDTYAEIEPKKGFLNKKKLFTKKTTFFYNHGMYEYRNLKS